MHILFHCGLSRGRWAVAVRHSAGVMEMPLEVKEEVQHWRERGQRLRDWVSVEQAMVLVDEPQLVQMLKAAKAALLFPKFRQLEENSG